MIKPSLIGAIVSVARVAARNQGSTAIPHRSSRRQRHDMVIPAHIPLGPRTPWQTAHDREPRRALGPLRRPVSLGPSGVAERHLVSSQPQVQVHHGQWSYPHCAEPSQRLDLTASEPNQKWGGDITAIIVAQTGGAAMTIRTHEGRIRLATITDLSSRRDRPGHRQPDEAGSSAGAPNMVTARRGPHPDGILHADRGWRYGAHDDQKPLHQRGPRMPMSGKDKRCDKFVVERRTLSLIDGGPQTPSSSCRGPNHPAAQPANLS